ncbi:hypothetical protein [Streptomyces galbus]|uniref:Uncharacterized protein n=1 Tax=Streptomyces galbus TaxID=33898 RepID=A0A4U5X8B7_STRGB|nr:hypothetical protein [Streptomyces galbus]TKT11424.1 hypothetical protein E4U92_00640 [Streptomyces galbus]GHD30165.1 hypothetical protein GCM10010335_19950 [Streptomyces galbus]
MAKFFENAYGNQQAIRRNAWTVVAASLVAYALSAVLWAKGGFAAASPLLLVAVVADAVCLLVYLTFRNRRLGSSK